MPNQVRESLRRDSEIILEIKNLEGRIYRREKIVLFTEVAALVERISPNATIFALTRQRQLAERRAAFEHEGYVIYPFYSFVITPSSVTRFQYVTEDKEEVLNLSSQTELSIQSEFVIVTCGNEDRHIATALHSLLHAYFVNYELERCVERSAYLLMQQKSQISDSSVHHFEVLKRINHEKFKINTIFLSASEEEGVKIQSTDVPKSNIPSLEVMSKLYDQVVKFRQSRSIEITSEENALYVYAIPMRYGFRGRVSEVMILISENQELSMYSTKLNEYYVRLVVDKVMARGRNKFQRDVQDAIIKQKLESSTKMVAFTSFCAEITKKLSYLTSSHSVTIRRFNAFTNSLDLIAGCNAGTLSMSNHNSISCDPSQSVNAFCFLQNEEAHVYLPNISNIPEKYKSKGLQAVFRAREQTNSEICFSIGTTPLKLGTLNMESANYAAYELDIEFLDSIAFHVSQYWNALNMADDAWWLSQLSLTHLATHELRDFKGTLDPPQRRALENIISTISPADHFTKDTERTWSSFLNFLKRQHNRLAAPNKFDSIWRIVGIDPEENMSTRFLGSLRLIVQSILSNTRHSDYERNKISLEKFAIGCKSIISIHYNSCVSYVDPDSLVEIERRFSVPAFSADGWHFGLFLIGVHARFLGGDIEVDPACKREYDYGAFSYIVRVPVPEV